MAVDKWALDNLLVCVVGAMVLGLGLALGAHAAFSIGRAIDRSLESKARSIARILTHEIAGDVLTENHVAVQETLLRAQEASAQLRYLVVVDATGVVIARSFRDPVPDSLREAWAEGVTATGKINVAGEPLIGFSEPVLAPDVATLHIGISRVLLIAEKNRVVRMIILHFLIGAGMLIAILRIIAGKISQPVRALEARVSAFPGNAALADTPVIGGTREIKTLADGFATMVERLKALEGEHMSTQQRMIHAERLAVLGEVAAGLAHEIHNPLDGMQECLRYLQEERSQTDKARKYYPMLQDGLDRIARTMREMLNFARSGQGICLQPVKVKDVLRSLSLLVDQQLSGRRVKITWPSSTVCVCLCDKHALSQACLNLILNAAEAAETNSAPEVRVNARCDKHWVYLTVEDNGPGVTPALAQKIFEPFFTSKGSGKGTGLGLSVSRELIWASNGELQLEQTPGSLGGAMFTIKLKKGSAYEACTDK